ncbi:MAG: prolyl oligopeptidase family serine peptidase [Caldilineaceae bacterium]|nr:prolyl oligopeptidase family serine peptidase [Caldilineaceae bacterium]
MTGSSSPIQRPHHQRQPHRRSRQLRWLLIVVFSYLIVPGPAQAAPLIPLVPFACEDGMQASGAAYRICMPDHWNNRLVVYAHGYVAPNRPLGIPEDQMRLPGSSFSVDQLVTSLGYAFATSGYSTNGLAIEEGLQDLVDVVDLFTAQKGTPEKVLLAGVSEGGAITALALERHPDIFDGGLAMCGPYGSFRDQINYLGDFRVLFDYFFPAVMPPTPIHVPTELLDSWETSYYTNTIRPVLTDPANATQVDALLATGGVAFDPNDPTTKLASSEELLWYNVFATNDATTKLGGQPFDNQTRQYTAPTATALLNQQVARYTADATALSALAASYETSGQLANPLVTLHTTGDPVVPYQQAMKYRTKTMLADNLALHQAITVNAYGHCRFSNLDILGAFNQLITLVNNPPAYQPVRHLYLPLMTQ